MVSEIGKETFTLYVLLLFCCCYFLSLWTTLLFVRLLWGTLLENRLSVGCAIETSPLKFGFCGACPYAPQKPDITVAHYPSNAPLYYINNSNKKTDRNSRLIQTYLSSGIKKHIDHSNTNGRCIYCTIQIDHGNTTVYESCTMP